MWASDVVWNSEITVRLELHKSRSLWCTVTPLCQRFSDVEGLIPFLFPFSHFSNRNCGWTRRDLHPIAFIICVPIVESRQARRPTSREQTSPWSPVLSVDFPERIGIRLKSKFHSTSPAWCRYLERLDDVRVFDSTLLLDRQLRVHSTAHHTRLSTLWNGRTLNTFFCKPLEWCRIPSRVDITSTNRSISLKFQWRVDQQSMKTSFTQSF